ncbi:hypothetical protein LAM01_05740 [Amylolactobacillus amylophilus]|nr:hypothetical protein LAM01_05740 [Amylolactobacillus amylophilus]
MTGQKISFFILIQNYLKKDHMDKSLIHVAVICTLKSTPIMDAIRSPRLHPLILDATAIRNSRNNRLDLIVD